jgi:hypothetical protein
MEATEWSYMRDGFRVKISKSIVAANAYAVTVTGHGECYGTTATMAACCKADAKMIADSFIDMVVEAYDD